MITQCHLCHRYYDDEHSWTICPHGPLEWPIGSYCPICDTITFLHGPCRHKQAQEKFDRIQNLKYQIRKDWMPILLGSLVGLIVGCGIAIVWLEYLGYL